MGDFKFYKEQREYLWNYFQLHSSQRLTTFNFYIVFSTVLATGNLNVMIKSDFWFIGTILGLMLTFLSFIFWTIDSRNRQLIKNAETALRFIEEKITITNENEVDRENILQIFTYEDRQTKALRAKKSFRFWTNIYSYSVSFNLVFAVFGTMGIVSAIYSLTKSLL